MHLQEAGSVQTQTFLMHCVKCGHTTRVSWFAKRRTTRTTKVGLAISDPSKMATNNCVHNTSFTKELNSWYIASVNTCVVCKMWTYNTCVMVCKTPDN